MRIHAPWAAMLLLAALIAPTNSAAQSDAQQLLLQNPELVRQRLRESGLSADDIRARLRAGGYPDNLLDNYLGDVSPGSGATQTSPTQLAAIQALGILPFAQNNHLDTGLVRRRDTTHSEVFGVDVFERASTQFLPLLAGPVPPDYRLGPGDQLVLILTGDVQKAYALPVTRDGFILIPQVGQVFVSSLTLDQLRELLYERLGRVYASVRRGPDSRTRFDVTIGSVHANQIFVVGEVTQPGAYQISSLATVFTALYAAGGLTDKANLRRVAVQRLGKTVATLDLYDYLLRGDTRADIRLETGDVVLVPLYDSRVQLRGAIARPAIYEAKPDETLAELIAIAGGFRSDAALRRITIHRVLPTGRAAIDVALTPAPAPIASHTTLLGTATPHASTPHAVTSNASTPHAATPHASTPHAITPHAIDIPSITLIDGDSIVIDSVPALERSLFVSIDGMVTKPGRYPWHEGMTLRDLVLLARGPTIGASLREAEIARLPADRTGGELAATLRVPLDSTYLLERDSLGRYLGPPGAAFPA
ncbi:MAG TPA: SLBB domain-containing protein, partial [Gemmatimonadales bacterium]|nr:SLBB domain-containing protein [Gemmatimonadales bacterium]